MIQKNKKITPNPIPTKSRIKGIDFREFYLRIDMPIWNAMMKAGLQKGEVTDFIKNAIQEKLARNGGRQ